MPLYLTPFQCGICQHPKASNDVPFQMNGFCTFLYRKCLVHSWLSTMLNQCILSCWLTKKFVLGLYRPIYCWHPYDIMFKMSLWKSIKYDGVLHHFNARLEICNPPSRFTRTPFNEKKRSTSQNWNWPRSPSLSQTLGQFPSPVFIYRISTQNVPKFIRKEQQMVIITQHPNFWRIGLSGRVCKIRADPWSIVLRTVDNTSGLVRLGWYS